jgi:hypothetical protein
MQQSLDRSSDPEGGKQLWYPHFKSAATRKHGDITEMVVLPCLDSCGGNIICEDIDWIILTETGSREMT